MIISDWSAPGRIFGKPAWACTPEEIFTEVWQQLSDHLGHLSERPRDEWVVERFLDPAISHPARLKGRERIAENDEPLLINTPGSWDDRPEATTPVPNLMLAGAAEVTAFDRWMPPENEPMRAIDAERYRLGLPHVLDTPWPDELSEIPWLGDLEALLNPVGPVGA